MADGGEVVGHARILGEVGGPAAGGRVAPGVPGKERDLRGREAVAEHVVREEVVERVGADHRLGRLQRARLGIRGDEFGADLLRQDGGEDLIGLGIVLFGADAPADQELDQRLGHARVDRIVAHLVANAVGAPAERQFAEVAGAEHEAAALVGEAEEIVGAEPRLDVLEGDVVDRLACREGVAKPFEQHPRGGADVDLLRSDAERAHQRPGLALGRLAGGEARHGEAEDARALPAEPVGGLGGDDQCVGRVEPARHADHERLGAARLQPLGEAFHLDVERLVAVGVALVGVVGDEGEAADVAAQAPVGGILAVEELDAAEARLGMAGERCGVVEGAEAGALLHEALAIDVGDGEFGRARESLRLGEELAQFVDQALAVPGEIGGALADAGGGIDIGADGAGRLGGGEHRALAGLADDDV